jgi:hypothetical protein
VICSITLHVFLVSAVRGLFLCDLTIYILLSCVHRGLNLAMLIFFLSSFQNMGIVIIFWLPGNYIWQLYLISLIISSRSSGFYWLSVCYVEACHLGFSLSYCVNPSTTKAVRYMFTFALLYLCMQIYVLSRET